MWLVIIVCCAVYIAAGSVLDVLHRVVNGAGAGITPSPRGEISRLRMQIGIPNFAWNT